MLKSSLQRYHDRIIIVIGLLTEAGIIKIFNIKLKFYLKKLIKKFKSFSTN